MMDVASVGEYGSIKSQNKHPQIWMSDFETRKKNFNFTFNSKLKSTIRWAKERDRWMKLSGK